MCTSLVIWYIVDGHIAGVLVFVFVFIFIEVYFVLAYPRFIIVALLSIVTQGGIFRKYSDSSSSLQFSVDSWI